VLSDVNIDDMKLQSWSSTLVSGVLAAKVLVTGDFHGTFRGGLSRFRVVDFTRVADSSEMPLLAPGCRQYRLTVMVLKKQNQEVWTDGYE
jgi:hypothetical protein